MSADNQVVVFQFQKENNEIVWRVMHCSLSGQSYEIYKATKKPSLKPGNFSPELQRQYFHVNYVDFPNRQEAILFAHEWESVLDVCEYGVDELFHGEPAKTAKDLYDLALLEYSEMVLA